MEAPSLCAAGYRALCISEQGASRYGSSLLRVTGEIRALCTRVPELYLLGDRGSVHQGTRAPCTK